MPATSAPADGMRDGEARMHFLPVDVEPDRITAAAPSDVRRTPPQAGQGP